MGLHTIRKVSLEYSVSARMLRYYEQIGLLESTRIKDYAYRVYDETAIKRLALIILLRKLQIPVKQIIHILANQDALAVIEVFKRNIEELDERITALSSVRSILARFVDEMHQKADVRLKLDLLNDKTMLAVAGSLSFSENKIGDKVSPEELRQADERLRKQAEEHLRIVYRLPSMVAVITCAHDENGEDWNARRKAEALVKRFIEDTNLYRLKPDLRVWGFTDGKFERGGWTMWVTVPDGFVVPPSFTLKQYHGGLFAAYPNWDFDFTAWSDESELYEWNHQQCGTAEEYFNPFNIYGFTHIESGLGGAMYTDVLYPIKEIGKMTDKQKGKITALEKARPRRVTDIDLTTMIKTNDIEIHYENGMLIMHKDGDNGSRSMTTREVFTCPLRITLRAKTDDTNIRLQYHQGIVLINWEHERDTLVVFDVATGQFNTYKKRGRVPVNEFVDVEWTIGREIMTLKINGELRHAGDDYPYIEAVKENGLPPAPVGISTAFGSTVTVTSLTIAELP
ncbi:MAG: MerR family transcriptional regulator [Defluviitaleaceae bacterium]|nr:MerR family transcriptional regulator [Defluviitaleaceae bacterium]